MFDAITTASRPTPSRRSAARRIALVSTAVSRHDAPPVASAAPVAWAALLGHSPMRPRSAPDATRRATPRRPMDHPPPSRALARALELVRGLALPRGARVL